MTEKSKETWNGEHPARAVEWALRSVGQNETPAVAVRFRLTDGPRRANYITWDGWLTDKAFDRTIESLQYCGWKGDDLRDLQGLDANEVSLVIELEDYTDPNGEFKQIPKVRWVNGGSGLSMKGRMTESEAAVFAEKMRGRIHAMQKKKGNDPAAARASNSAGNGPRNDAPPHQDDDIPF